MILCTWSVAILSILPHYYLLTWVYKSVLETIYSIKLHLHHSSTAADMATPSGRVLIKRQLKLHEDQALPSTIPLLIRDNYQYDEENHKLVERPEMAERSSKFKLVSAAVKLLASIKKPVAVLAICGPTRTGKSYFLSQMLEMPDAFQLGHTMQGCTHGIWMGTSVLECDEFVLLLLDTEGINAASVSGADDAVILIMSILLSSYLIYNSMRVPTRNDLEEMR